MAKQLNRKSKALPPQALKALKNKIKQKAKGVNLDPIFLSDRPQADNVKAWIEYLRGDK